jgi:hypothetical protein
MRGLRRAVLIALLIGVGPVLAGCADFDMDKLDVFGLNKKDRLPGERHAVFPEGVPGVTQGIPPELTKGHEGEQVGAAVPLNTPPAAQPEPEKKTAAVEPARTKPKPKRVHKVSHRKPAKPAPEQAAAPSRLRRPHRRPAAGRRPRRQPSRRRGRRRCLRGPSRSSKRAEGVTRRSGIATYSLRPRESGDPSRLCRMELCN